MTERLDVTNEPDQPPRKEETGRRVRPFLGIKFACCGIYSRIYQNKDATYYIGNCPKCAKQVRIKIGHGGSNTRFFTAY